MVAVLVHVLYFVARLNVAFVLVVVNIPGHVQKVNSVLVCLDWDF